MIRKICTAVAASAVLIGASLGMAGVANAATPVPSKCTTINGLVHCGIDGVLGGGGDLLRGGHRGGHLGGDFRRGGFYRNINSGVVLSYDQVVSSCGCAGVSAIPSGYVLVQDPQVVAVPVGGIETGDASCGLSSVNFGRLGGIRRGFHRF